MMERQQKKANKNSSQKRRKRLRESCVNRNAQFDQTCYEYDIMQPKTFARQRCESHVNELCFGEFYVRDLLCIFEVTGVPTSD